MRCVCADTRGPVKACYPPVGFGVVQVLLVSTYEFGHQPRTWPDPPRHCSGSWEPRRSSHSDRGCSLFGDDDLKTAIEHETGNRPPFALAAFSEVDADVRQSIARIEASRFSPRKDQLRGFVYQVTTGKRREVTEST